MQRRNNLFLVALIAMAAFLAGSSLGPGLSSAGSENPVDALTPEQQQAVQSLKLFSDGFAAVAEAVIPSVVTITSERVIRPRENSAPLANDPFLQRFFGGRSMRPYRQHGLGSGVIVDASGHILTNNHVIRGADELTVILHDGTELEARVVGADVRTDLAVLKVDAEGLRPVQFGDSDAIRIGEWVMAVGSPFSTNLQATTTAGIVSATGRSGMHLSDYENFIQTDAAINPGNSGGALVNLDGELIGINSAIASRAGGSNGIGFSIPSNMALGVMNDLIERGRVTRGYLGVGIQTVTADLAEALDLEEKGGVLVTRIEAGAPADRAGVMQGDVIIEFEGERMEDADQLRFAVADVEPGTRSELAVLRDGIEKSLEIELAEYPDPEAVVAGSGEERGRDLGLDLGLDLTQVTPELQRRFNLEVGTGLVVTTVEPGGAADDAGIEPGDVVTAVNRRAVTSARDYRSAIEATRSGKPALLRINRRGNTFFTAVRPE